MKTSMTQNRMKNETERKCFVPNCINKKILDDRGEVQQEQQRLQFFQVPDGIEGLFWEKSVRIRKRKYDKMIDLLSSTDYTLGLDNMTKAPPKDYEYCCELHFDIEADIERIIKENGKVDYRVKPGAVPQIKPKQSKELLCDYYEVQGVLSESECEMKIDIVKKEEPMTISNEFQECSPEATTNGYISLVDISTLTNKNKRIHHETKDINCEPILPMLPLTMAMMKRKSPYYMGLQSNHFLQLLEMAKQNGLSEVKVMITLRKLRLNEEFEALGDLFDLNKTTTERFFQESKDHVAYLVDNLVIPSSTNGNLASPEVVTKFCVTRDEEDSVLELNAVVQDENDDCQSTSSESSSSYAPSESDPDVLSDDLTSPSDESELCSENEWFTSRGLSKLFLMRHPFRLNLNRTTCGLCLQNFDTNALLREHQRQAHDGNAYGCDVCNKKFRQRPQIDRHILSRHAELKAFLCELCGNGFPYQGDLTLHLKRKHWKFRRYECHLCDKKYQTLPDLRNHIRSIHSLERPFVCEFNGCGKRFSRKNVLFTHSRVHAADKFECNICSKQFSYKCNLATHKRNVHGMVI